MKHGKIFLIGAGPGDVELLTLAAVRAIGQADVLLLDDLVNPDILQFARPGARLIHVGKRGGCRSTPQAFIHRQMIVLARQGQIVARVKGGDPFIFGRGGEEQQMLQQAGCSVSVISGISAGVAAPATLGIPLTHRELTHGVTFITGHTRDGDAPDWQALVRSRTTLVIYMGMSHMTGIVDALLDAGLSPHTATAAIQHGTLPQQRQVITTLAALPGEVAAAGLGSPAILVIGEVVGCARAASSDLQQRAA